MIVIVVVVIVITVIEITKNTNLIWMIKLKTIKNLSFDKKTNETNKKLKEEGSN